MRKAQLLLISCVLLGCCSVTEAQKVKTSKPQKQNDAATIEKEIKEFFDLYAEDLRSSRREAIANRYDSRGYFRLGNGAKTFVSFEDVKKQYLTTWTGPKSFGWKDISIEVLSPDAVVVTALFDWWQPAAGEKQTFSYTALLIKEAGKWHIRVEDESISPVGWTIRHTLGNRDLPGPFKYILRAQAGASIAAHRHSVEMRVKVISGRVCLLMGDFVNARVQVFETGSSFAIAANVWHVEWWEAETVVEVEGIGPMLTERATPSTPRTP
jgi:hypothetical protein